MITDRPQSQFDKFKLCILIQVEDAGSGPGARFRLREMTNKRDTAKDEADQKKLIAEAKQMAEVNTRLSVLSGILWNIIWF